MINKTIIIFIVFFFSSNAISRTSFAPWVGVDLNGFPCNGGRQGYGPYDYTIPSQRANIPIVERHHFTHEVKNLISGESGTITGDLDYTLRAAPNHHEALLTIIRYQINLNKKLANKNTNRPLVTPVECYFQRAINFSPKDAAAVSLYAYYLKKINLLNKSAEIYEKALTINPESAKIEYSYSLLLIDLKQYKKAVIHAKKAYELGNPPLGLKKKLKKLGKW